MGQAPRSQLVTPARDDVRAVHHRDTMGGSLCGSFRPRLAPEGQTRLVTCRDCADTAEDIQTVAWRLRSRGLKVS